MNKSRRRNINTKNIHKHAAAIIQYYCQMSIDSKYALDGSKIVVLSYVNDYVYWYTNKALGK